MKTALIMIVMLGFAMQAEAQTTPQDEIGVLFFFDYNMHSADFRALPGVPSCCPQYTSGDGFGYTLGLVYEFPINADLSLSTRLLLADISALLVSEEHEIVSLDGQSYDGVFEHSIDASLMSVGLEPLAQYRLSRNFTVGAGINLSVLSMRDYHQKEEIISPEQGVFVETGTRVRLDESGQIESTSGLLFSGVAALRMYLPVGDGSFALYPELSYIYTFSNLVEGLQWNPHAIRVGVAVQTTL